ncbi:MAG: hypothetical protein JST75_14230 [Bacteroidetes bacterium]|nr:hypothetical protein [Bacteroidota bacterium]
MKKTILICLVALLCLTQAHAQKESKKFSVGFGFEPGIPTGQLTNLYNFSMGITVRFSFHAGPGFATLTTGGVGFAPKKIEGQPEKVALEIPFRVGYKYIIQHHLFFMGEVGYASFKTYYGKNGGVSSLNNGSFIAAPTIGYTANAFEIGLRYGMNFNASGGVVAVRVGFNF